MKLREFAVLALALSVPCLLSATVAGPVVANDTINYTTKRVTLNGSGFEPGTTAPVVRLDGGALTIISFSNSQIVADLPTTIVPATYGLTITTSLGAVTAFDMTYGATGPQGPIGPAGPTGPTGPQGPAGTPPPVWAKGALATQLTGTYSKISEVVLSNPGTYLLTGSITIYMTGSNSNNTNVVCAVADGNLSNAGQALPPIAEGTLSPQSWSMTLPVNGLWVSTASNTPIWLWCYSGSPYTNSTYTGNGTFIAMQVTNITTTKTAASGQ